MQPIRREGLLVSEILPLCQPEQLRLGPAGAATLVPSGLLHLQRGGPTGPGADPKPVSAGVVRLSPLPSDDEGVGVIPESRAGEAGARFPGMDQCE